MNSKEYKYIIGLDLSLTEPGWAKYNVESKKLMFGIIDVKAYKGFYRIHEILDNINELFTEPEKITGYNEYLVVLEGYSFASKGNSSISLGELGGVVRYEFWKNTVDYKEVPPTVLKKFVSGKGNSGKELILRDIYKNFNIEVDNNNAADAIGLCYIGRSYLNCSDVKINKEQEKVVEAIFNPKEKK